MTFSDDQLRAAKAFAQTMIVVDDEPTLDEIKINNLGDNGSTDKLQTPLRIAGLGKTPVLSDVASPLPKTHKLNTRALVQAAIKEGIVCSVVNPTENREEVKNGIIEASKRADIISLDWNMQTGDISDDGKLAIEIIQGILREDNAIGGRLRLISIYTGVTVKDYVLNKIKTNLESFDIHLTITADTNALIYKNIVRIIWILKDEGMSSHTNSVKEVDLPSKLLKEFSKLSSGLLTNVALATIASLRDSTHHVLSKFSQKMDGPYLYHHASLDGNTDAKDYAISVIQSTLKNEVGKVKINENYISNSHIDNTLSTLLSNTNDIKLSIDENKSINIELDDVKTIVKTGFNAWMTGWNKKNDKKADYILEDEHIKNIKNNFLKIFEQSLGNATELNNEFSFITSTKSSERSAIHQSIAPRLDLGSIIHQEKEDIYYLCLQATCDTVRIKKPYNRFFFIPLEGTKNKNPTIVIPHKKNHEVDELIGLRIPRKCYTTSVSLGFDINKAQYIEIPYDSVRKGFYFLANPVNKQHQLQETPASTKKEKNINPYEREYRWLANLKHRKALNIAQQISQQISRVGLDEYEPYREGFNSY